MPTYSYRCTECGHAFDIQQAFTDATLTECPSCGGALRKIFSPVGITFNGSGFYRTDSRAKPSGDGGTGGADAGAAKKEKSGGQSAASTPSKSDSGSGSTSGSGSATKTSTPGTSSGTTKAATSSAAS